MKRLSARSMACLLHMQGSGVCSARELEDVQRRQPNGWNRSAMAVKHTPFNLEALGYIKRASSTSAAAWELTEQGRAVLEFDGQYQPTHGATATTLEPPVPTRTIGYGRGRITIPAVARWVFDLGAQGGAA